MLPNRIICFLLPLYLVLLSVIVAGAEDNGANVFIYHRFGDSRYPSTNTPLELFEEQLEFLKSGDYRVMKLSAIVDLLRHKREIPDRVVALSVDDAFLSFHQNALPLLQKYGFPVTPLGKVSGPVPSGSAGPLRKVAT